jgi:TetR/AcrR family transcriptional regulator
LKSCCKDVDSNMSVADRKERERQQRRNDIIDAAERKFFEKGFDGVSMDEIARELELSKPTIYLYFKNKESLFLAVVMRGMAILAETFKAGVESHKTGLGKARGFIRGFFDYAKRYPDHYRLLTAARTRRFMNAIRAGEVDSAADFGNKSMEMLTLLLDAIQLGQEDGTIRKGLDPLETAIFLSMACEGAVQMTPEWEYLLEYKHVTIDHYYEHSTDVILHGIAGENKQE